MYLTPIIGSKNQRTMDWIRQLFNGGLGRMTDIIDDFTLSKQEKQEFKLRLQSALMKQQ